jgi:hypothetical protein
MEHFNRFEAMDEEDAFAICTTSELYALGLIDDSVMDG